MSICCYIVNKYHRQCIKSHHFDIRKTKKFSPKKLQYRRAEATDKAQFDPSVRTATGKMTKIKGLGKERKVKML